jgi:SAM-dependent methyltransferase
MRIADTSADQIRNRLDLEVQLAAQLRRAERAQRPALYRACYDRYYSEFPEVHQEAPEREQRITAYEATFARRFLKPEDVVVELGPGRCYLAFALAAHVREVIGIDVSEVVSAATGRPANFRLLLGDGVHIPLANDSTDLVVSAQLMEHVHPDDAEEQLREIWRVLRPGGRYVCVTPNRLYGPHDDSRFADNLPIVDGTFVATGFHLKEYTNAELAALFRRAGFRRLRAYAGARGRYVPLPVPAVTLLERALRRIPVRVRSRINLLRLVLGSRMVAEK